MPETLVRSGVLLLLGLVSWLLVWSGRHFVEKQRHRVLTAPLELAFPAVENRASPNTVAPVRILAFSSADCSQCHQFQTPALQRVMEAYGEQVSIVEVDAPNDPALTQRYRVLTVPTTVLLDAAGRARVVNYGFANSKKLLEQVGEVMG
ncbi:MAG TPA: thioredoxin family protein [Ktedonobacteraceae bacterium]